MNRYRISLAVSILVSILYFQTAQTTRAYWQQDVLYKMDVNLAEDGRTLLGHLILQYQNNSPDTLRDLRFHTYFNSFKPGSPAHRRWKARGSRRIEEANPVDHGNITLRNVKIASGDDLTIVEDFSIVVVPLTDPLLPGQTIILTMDFESHLPGAGVAYRSQYANGQLKCAHWYPQVCVYDPVMGWVDNQYMGTGETYGEFGTFDVNLTLPEPFVVGASGVLVNRDEVLPDTLLSELAIEHYLEWPWGKEPETTFGDWEERKTWHFVAENVHDFAWVADPLFRIDRDRCGQTDIWILVRQDHASRWYDAAEVTREGMAILEREIGPFPYPEFTVADCYSGMEYPGIVFCGGYSPRYKLLFWHEMAHNYFMGALGFNQTERSFLDEGFTTYWEIRIMEELLGVRNILRQRYQDYAVMDIDRWYRGFRPYLQRQKSGYILPLHIESDLPEVYLQYRVSSYYKPACMLYALQSLAGEEGMRRIMHHFYDTWKFRHPYEQDYLRCAEEALGTSLQWFYEAWVRGSKSLDYAISAAHSSDKGLTEIRVKRKGDMLLPVKFDAETKAGERIRYYVPIGDEPTPPDCVVRLPNWDQRRDPHDEYRADISVTEFKRAYLDPDGMLTDVNPLNNTTSLLPPMQWEFDYPMMHVSPVDAYRVRWAPTAFYNGIDGFQGGVYFQGDFMERWRNLDLALRVGALTGKVSADFSYSNFLSSLGRGTRWGVEGYLHEGHRGGSLKLQHDEKKGYDERVRWSGTIRWYAHELFDRAYPPDPELWEDGVISALVLSGTINPHLGDLHASGTLSMETAAPFSDFPYTRSTASATVTYPLTRHLASHLRGFFGTASNGTPRQHYFGLGGGGPLARAQNRWLRAWASLPPDWDTRAPGDGNLTGYYSTIYEGPSVVSVQGELVQNLAFFRNGIMNDLPPRFRPQVEFALFAGTGDVGHEWRSHALDRFYQEASFALRLRFPGGSELEAGFPVYLSDPYDGEAEWKWRTVIGLTLIKE